MASRCGWVTSLVRKTETWILSNQKSFIVLICLLISSADPSMASEIITVRISAKSMLTLRVRPSQVSDRMKRRRTELSSAGVAVDAATLVARDLAVVELDHPATHRVDDVRVVRRHHDRGAGAVDAVEQPHDADAGRRVEVAGRLVGEQQHRSVDERPRDRYTLLLTAAELVRHAFFVTGEADVLEHVGDDLRDGHP